MQPSNFSGLSLFILYWEAQLNSHVYSTITFKVKVDLVQRITWPVQIELPSHSLPGPCSIAFVWKLLKLRIPGVVQTTVVKICITLVKSEIFIPYHKNHQDFYKKQKNATPHFISKIFSKLFILLLQMIFLHKCNIPERYTFSFSKLIHLFCSFGVWQILFLLGRKRICSLNHQLSQKFVKFCYHNSLQVPNKNVLCNTVLQKVSIFYL